MNNEKNIVMFLNYWACHLPPATQAKVSCLTSPHWWSTWWRSSRILLFKSQKNCPSVLLELLVRKCFVICCDIVFIFWMWFLEDELNLLNLKSIYIILKCSSVHLRKKMEHIEIKLLCCFHIIFFKSKCSWPWDEALL